MGVVTFDGVVVLDGSNQKKMNLSKMNLSFVAEMTSDSLNRKETETGLACLNQKKSDDSNQKTMNLLKMNISFVAEMT